MGELAKDLREALADRYTIERELGRGGMATVFLARDLKHDRPVALKVLHPELSQALGPERFQREIRLAARLQHPHILTVLDSGESEGRLWFTMPFIEGESLRDRLNRETQLPLDDALRIARESADALDYAHQHGIVHRDIKPENILLAGRHALVADFGIARALGASGGDQLTETGMTVGTPAYMSPEQASGARDFDGRSDIYSLAVVLYEMLAGETPFSGPTVQAMIARRLTETARPIRTIRETVPESVDQAVAQALAKAPADRFGTAGEFARALEGGQEVTRAGAQGVAPTMPAIERQTARPPDQRRPHRPLPRSAMLLGLGFVIGLGVLFGWLRRHSAEPTDTGGARRLAVMPFENLGAPGDEYFADGVTDEVRGKLASLPGLQVTARSSSNQYKKTTKTPQEIGRELGVDYLLTGTVRWEKGSGGNRVRVSPELIQVSTASTKWQQPFDAALSDVFQVQGDIAGRVAQALNVALEAPKQEQLHERPTQNLAAYDAYLKGEEAAQGIWAIDPATLRRAARYYEQAVALDSSFAPAWAQLSRTLSYAYYIGNPVAADAERARVAADRAVALAPNRAEGLLARGDYFRYVKQDHRQAQEQYAEGQHLAPNNADLLTGGALALEGLGRWDRALEDLRKAMALDPRSTNTARRLAFTLLWLRRYPAADSAYDRALALGPTNLQAIEGKAMVQLAQANLDGARAVLKSVPQEVEPTALVAYVSTYWDLNWMLDQEQQSLLLRLTPAAFDDDRATWAIVLTQAYHLRGDETRTRIYADSAVAGFKERVSAAPNDPQSHAFLGLSLAYSGHRAEAVSEGEKAAGLSPIARDGYNGPYYQHLVARIYTVAGEPEKAVSVLESLLKIPYYLSPAWLKIDPNFTPLRGNPRFERLVKGER